MKLIRMWALASGIAAVALAPSTAGAQVEADEEVDVEVDEAQPPDVDVDMDVGQTPSCPTTGEAAAGEQLPPECQRQPVRGQEGYAAPTYQQPVVVQPVTAPPPRERGLLTNVGVGFLVGGGVSEFSNDEMQDLTDVGGAWDARLVIGTRFPIAFEAAYVGSAYDIDALGLDEDAVLLGNGAEGNLRFNLPTPYVQPFIFGGASWIHYNLTNDDFNTSAVADNDDVFAIPFGGGIAGQYGNFIGDARFTYRVTFDNDLLDATAVSPGGDDELDSWAVTGRVGFRF